MTGWLPTAVLLPYSVAALLPLLAGRRTRTAGRLASITATATLYCVARAAAEGLHHPQHDIYPWASRLGLSFSILTDGLSLLFALLISAVGVIVAAYAAAYLDESENRRRFFVYLLLFMGSMLGVVTAGNLIALFVFWELTSVTSFLLIGFWHKTDRSRDGALKALVVTSSGGLAMLVGFVITGIVCGSFEIPTVVARAGVLAAHPLASAAAVLVLVGAMTKSAQLPFHLWLPSAMEAPTPVSAYLHAATMVKAGLFLVARLGPAFGRIPLWTPVLTAVGIATMTWAGLLALRQRDLKALLAFSTVSQLGLILVLLAPARPESTAAGLLHVLNHAAFKGALFLLVGIIEHEVHTRDLGRLPGLARSMPVTSALLAVAALSMAGVPPLGGFVSKELFLEHILALSPLAAATACAGAVLTAAYCVALIIGVVFGHPGATPTAAAGHEAPASLLWGPALLVTAAVALGPWAQPLAASVTASAAAATVSSGSEAVHLHLALWHGLTPALGVGVGAVLLGALGAMGLWRRRLPEPRVLAADRVYGAALSGLERGARAVTRSYMSGLLWRYNAIILAVTLVVVAGAVLVSGVPSVAGWNARPVHAFECVVAAAAAAAALGACLARTRLAAILALGANGYMLAVLFGVLGAPDLALTQVMVETVSVALFLAAFALLPATSTPASARLRPLHVSLATLFGAGTAWCVLVARAHRVAPSIADYFVANSVGRAGGHNVVNVILVDFRGLDTMGEISVLAVAALASFAVIVARRSQRGAP